MLYRPHLLWNKGRIKICVDTFNVSSATIRKFITISPVTLESETNSIAFIYSSPLPASPPLLLYASTCNAQLYEFGLALMSQGLEPLATCVRRVFTKYIHTYHSRFIPKGVAEASQILLRGPHFTKISCEEYCRRDRW
jgi:hypothetical protein